jgi:hypothetical protein
MFWAIIAENREAELNLVLRSIPFSHNKQRKNIILTNISPRYTNFANISIF